MRYIVWMSEQGEGEVGHPPEGDRVNDSNSPHGSCENTKKALFSEYESLGCTIGDPATNEELTRVLVRIISRLRVLEEYAGIGRK